MAQGKHEGTADQGSLPGLEKVGTGTALGAEIFEPIARTQFFSDFSPEDIAVLAGYIEVFRAQPGELIIREGDRGDFMLLVLDGEVDIFKRGANGQQQHMASVNAGMTLGEMSMIDGEPRFATCLASRATLFSVLTRDNMAKILIDHPALGAKILVKLVTMLSVRLRQSSARLLQYMEGGR